MCRHYLIMPPFLTTHSVTVQRMIPVAVPVRLISHSVAPHIGLRNLGITQVPAPRTAYHRWSRSLKAKTRRCPIQSTRITMIRYHLFTERTTGSPKYMSILLRSLQAKRSPTITHFNGGISPRSALIHRPHQSQWWNSITHPPPTASVGHVRCTRQITSALIARARNPWSYSMILHPSPRRASSDALIRSAHTSRSRSLWAADPQGESRSHLSGVADPNPFTASIRGPSIRSRRTPASISSPSSKTTPSKWAAPILTSGTCGATSSRTSSPTSGGKLIRGVARCGGGAIMVGLLTVGGLHGLNICITHTLY